MMFFVFSCEKHNDQLLPKCFLLAAQTFIHFYHSRDPFSKLKNRKFTSPYSVTNYFVFLHRLYFPLLYLYYSQRVFEIGGQKHHGLFKLDAPQRFLLWVNKKDISVKMPPRSLSRIATSCSQPMTKHTKLGLFISPISFPLHLTTWNFSHLFITHSVSTSFPILCLCNAAVNLSTFSALLLGAGSADRWQNSFHKTKLTLSQKLKVTF